MDDVVQPIVVGVDGSEPSQRALRWAAQAAVARDVPLAMVYAAGPSPAEEVLPPAEADVRDWYPDIECTTAFSVENPAAALVDASKQARMVVIGNRGHGGFHDLLVGSTSLYTAMHAACPVVVVRPQKPGEGGAADRIVVGVDGSQPGHAALALAFAEAQLTGKPVLAIHAFTPALTAYPTTGLIPQVPDLEDSQERAQDLLTHALIPWRDKHPDVDVETEVVNAPAPWILVQRSQGAHLVAAGSRGMGGFAGLLFGSAGHALIHHAGCPVLIAR